MGKLQHGHSKRGSVTRTYLVWQHMLSRCTHPGNKDWLRYGGRGISVCTRWLHSFDNFLADMGERPAGCTLDRKDNEKGYGPDNCRWATRAEQSRNKSNNRLLVCRGEERTLAEWGDIAGRDPTTIGNRIKHGLTVEDAIFAPMRARNPPRVQLEYRGESKFLCDWATEMGVSYNTMYGRFKKGYTTEEIINGRKRK